MLTAPTTSRPAQREYESEVVDFLDVVDPQVSTLATLTNVQNSLFVPQLGRFVNRRPTYDLAREERTPSISSESSQERVEDGKTYASITGRKRAATTEEEREVEAEVEAKSTTARSRKESISSALGDTYYAVLPHGVSIADWSEEDKQLLNDHVRHMLHSKRSKFKQGMKGFGQYVSKRMSPLPSLLHGC